MGEIDSPKAVASPRIAPVQQSCQRLKEGAMHGTGLRRQVAKCRGASVHPPNEVCLDRGTQMCLFSCRCSYLTKVKWIFSKNRILKSSCPSDPVLARRSRPKRVPTSCSNQKGMWKAMESFLAGSFLLAPKKVAVALCKLLLSWRMRRAPPSFPFMPFWSRTANFASACHQTGVVPCTAALAN